MSNGRQKIRHVKSQGGFTLVELMIVIAIVGVLAALAIYGVSTYLATARAAEAKESVGEISKLAAVVFERERAEAELLSGQGVSKAAVNALCDSATSVPAGKIPFGVQYQPNTANGADFNTGTATEGWICLGFSISTPIHYQYSYFRGSNYLSPAVGGPDPGPTGFEAVARGDLDADNTPSTFARTGIIIGNHLHLSTQIFVDKELE